MLTLFPRPLQPDSVRTSSVGRSHDAPRLEVGMKPAVYGALIAVALLGLSGCVDDSEKFTLGEPSLKILATGGCGFSPRAGG